MVNRLELIWNHGDGTIGFSMTYLNEVSQIALTLPRSL